MDTNDLKKILHIIEDGASGDIEQTIVQVFFKNDKVT